MRTAMCSKRRYATEREAQRTLGRVRTKRQRYGDKMQGTRRGLKIENRCYWCPECSAYHLTELSRREYNERRSA